MVPGAGVYRESAGQLFPAYFSKGKRAAHNRGLPAARGRTLEKTTTASIHTRGTTHAGHFRWLGVAADVLSRAASS